MDDEGPSDYWLRVPNQRVENASQERLTQCTPTPNLVIDSDMPEHEGKGGHAELESIPEPPQLSPESLINLHGTEEEEEVINEDSGPGTERSILPSPIAHTQTELRRSTRERRPKQFFTYEALGEPTVRSHVNTSSVTAFTVPYTAPTQPLTPPMSPVNIPYSCPIWYNQMSHALYTPVTYISPKLFCC